jgi:hypothetical protein
MVSWLWLHSRVKTPRTAPAWAALDDPPLTHWSRPLRRAVKLACPPAVAKGRGSGCAPSVGLVGACLSCRSRGPAQRRSRATAEAEEGRWPWPGAGTTARGRHRCAHPLQLLRLIAPGTGRGTASVRGRSRRRPRARQGGPGRRRVHRRGGREGRPRFPSLGRPVSLALRQAAEGRRARACRARPTQRREGGNR